MDLHVATADLFIYLKMKNGMNLDFLFLDGSVPRVRCATNTFVSFN